MRRALKDLKIILLANLWTVPVFAALLGSLWLDEQLQHYHWSGAALIFIGLLLAGRGTGFNAPRVPPAATAGAPGRSSV